MSERHVRAILREWVGHYNRGQPHASLGPGIPERVPLVLSSSVVERLRQCQFFELRLEAPQIRIAHRLLNRAAAERGGQRLEQQLWLRVVLTDDGPVNKCDLVGAVP